MNNERGFTYPLTFMLLLLFSLFLIYVTEQYLSEKRIFLASEIILQQEYYMASSVKEAEQRLQSDPTTLYGQLFYNYGHVSFRVEDVDAATLLITFEGKLVTNEKWEGYGYYDKENQKMIQWLERK